MMFAAAGRLRIAGSTGSESTEERTRSDGWRGPSWNSIGLPKFRQPNGLVV
jgi:hypothetical protein